jgi:hypothetical protein
MLHVAYNYALVQAFDQFWTKVLFYYTASCLFGVLEFQLLVGHYYRHVRISLLSCFCLIRTSVPPIRSCSIGFK